MNIPRMLSFLLIAMSLVLGGVAPSFADQPNQTKCPIRGSAVNKRVYTDYKGKRIYFCCPPCIPEFKRAPELYLKKMQSEGVVLEDSPGSSGR